MKNSGDKIIRQQVDNMQVRFDKEAAWMKLQDRLESRDEQKGYSRLGWIAAAVLLLSTVLWYSLSSDTRQPVVHTTPKIVQPISVEEPKKEVIEPVVAEKKSNAIVSNKKNIKVAVKQKEIIEAVKEIIPEPRIVKEETKPIQETPKIVSAPKPKMKTVHINELAEADRAERKMQSTKYADNKKNFFIKPAIEREDTKEPIYSLFGANKETAN